MQRLIRKNQTPAKGGLHYNGKKSDWKTTPNGKIANMTYPDVVVTAKLPERFRGNPEIDRNTMNGLTEAEKDEVLTHTSQRRNQHINAINNGQNYWGKTILQTSPGIILGGPVGAIGAVSGSIVGEDLGGNIGAYYRNRKKGATLGRAIGGTLGGMMGGVSNLHNLKDLGSEFMSNITQNVPDYLSSFGVSK